MKVLFASLSRIGDYIQHMIVVKAWAQAHPDVDVHVLVNDLIPADLMRMNSEFQHILLPRFEYQKKINQVNTPLLMPFWSLRKIINRLQAENYEQLFDLSLQTQSAAFLKLVDPKFSYSKIEKNMIDEYLNPSDSGHLIDKLKHAHDVMVSPLNSVGRKAKRLLLQVSSSDAKKNIDLPRWKLLVDQIRTDYTSIDLKVIGSRQEAKLLHSVFHKSEILVCSFTELSHVLDAESKLISLDTSIKHFAAHFQVPTIELSIGSSHWIKNAAYQTGNYVFSAEMECRPCSHSVACPFGRNQCQDKINFNELGKFVGEWIENTEPTVFPMITGVDNGNLKVLRMQGDKWKQKTNPTNLSL